MATTPVLKLQAATLYASGLGSTFTGTGGPYGFSPFTGQFGGPITSDGLLSQPFADTVYGVAAGDELTFVIAVQNMTPGAPAYNVALRDVLPAGFVIPAAGAGLTVIDGLGNDLTTSGDLFSAAGLTIASPLAGYDPSSGQNLALVTFSLDAATTVPGPYAALQTTAVLTGFQASTSGQNLAPANPGSASTTIVTAAPTPVVTPETDPGAVASGQTIAFDVTTNIPAGSLQNFTVSPVLRDGTASLQFVSSSVLSVGAALQATTPKVAADGSITFANVTLAPGATGNAAIVTRVVLRAAATVTGPATFEALVSAGNATSGSGYWSAGVSSSVGVIAPPPPPALSNLAVAQATGTGSPIAPFNSVAITDSTVQTGTLAITLLDPALGRLSTSGPGTLNAGGSTFTVSGPLATLQTAARQVVFTPGATGTERVTITVIDTIGGVAQSTAAVAVTTPALVPDPLFDAGYYLAHNPDVAAIGIDPLMHFEQYGWKEGRDPSAAFSVRDYLAANPDIKAQNVDPLLSYLQSGQAQGRAAFAVPANAPDPLVDAAAYYAAYPDVRAAGVDASAHYLAGGWTEGRNPSPYFDTNYYLTQNPDVRAAGVDPLLHFEVSGWREGRAPSLLFDGGKYLAANPDVKAAGLDPLLHFVRSGQNEGRSAFLTGGTLPTDPLVDTGFYDRQLGATLIPGDAAGAQQAAWSYDATGWRLGLNPDRLFDTTYYLSHNPDVAAAHVNPLLHYETSGWKEGRDPSAQFSTNKYLAAYADVRAAGADPLLHFVLYGQAEGRQAFNV